MISYEEAIDEIFNIANDAIFLSVEFLGYFPDIQWQGVEKPLKPDLSKYWFRVLQHTVNEEQSSLRNGNAGQRYTTDGLVFVQIFCPRSDSLAMTNGRKLAIIVRNSFRGKATSNKVWFRNARINELHPEENWYRFNVVSEYKYDENG